jgi:hypothetical protein
MNRTQFSLPHMRSNLSSLAGFAVVFLALALLGCGKTVEERLCGTWEGTTRIDLPITITIRPDSTIQSETKEDSGHVVRAGTYSIVDRRLRIHLTSVERIVGDSVRREDKIDHDEATFTFTGENEMVLRKGLQAIVLERVVQ